MGSEIMFAIPWYAILLISIPQTILVIKIGFELFGIKIDFKTAILVAIITGFITYFLRQSHVLPGIHTLALIFTVTLLVSFLARIYIWHSLVGSLLGFMILGVIEGLWLPFFLDLTSHTVESLNLYPWLNIIGFQPITIIAILIYLLILKNNLVIFKLGEEN
ncbi:MAG: hypothetical protein GX790_07025 [Syntrophomonadaceae bacterium]|nr:hypothetical protein [Syntrophomonadaceae bacterium]